MSEISLETYRRRYTQAGRKWKTHLLNEVCEMEGWTRKHTIKVMHWRESKKNPSWRGRPKTYGPEVSRMLEKLWLLMDQPCGKLMAPGLPNWLASYERHHGRLDRELHRHVMKISPAQIDRLLAPSKVRHPSKRRAGGGSVHLRNQIPVRVGCWPRTLHPVFWKWIRSPMEGTRLRAPIFGR